MNAHIAQNLRHRRQLEQHIVQIVSCLGALCDTHISIHTDTVTIRNGEAPKGKLNAGFDIDPIGKHFQFGLELIETEGSQISYHGNEIFHAYYGVSLKLPVIIERLFQSAYKNQLFPDAAFAMTGRATLQVEQLDYGTFMSALREGFVDFEFDNMTDTMLRNAYPSLLDSLVALMPWMKFVHFLAVQHYERQHLDNMQVEFSQIMKQAVLNPQVSDAHVFALCDLSGSYEPAMRLFPKHYNVLFA